MGLGVGIWVFINVLLLVAGGAATLWLTFWRSSDPADPPPLALATLVAGITCFGGAGVLALELFGFGPVLAFIAALLFALLSAVLFYLLASVAWQSRERRDALNDLVGALAAVVSPIAPDRPGAVAVKHSQPQLVLPAVSKHADPLPVGAQVIVTALHNGSGGDGVEVAPLPARGDRGDSAVA
jgi:membrane protein implicated in regulation of membrane protease activity